MLARGIWGFYYTAGIKALGHPTTMFSHLPVLNRIIQFSSSGACVMSTGSIILERVCRISFMIE